MLTPNPVQPTGQVILRRTRALGDLARPVVPGVPGVPPLAWRLRNLPHRLRGLPADLATALLGSLTGALTLRSALSGVTYRPDPTLAPEVRQRLRALLVANADPRSLLGHFGGHAIDYGLLSTRVITDAGVAFIVDAFQNLVELENMKYHGFGTGTTAEAASQTALVTELTTQYATNSIRPTGSQGETSANIYSTLGTLAPDADVAITEHGVFSQAATGGGVLLDRSVFAAVNLVAASSDTLAVTYLLTLTAGG